MKKYSIYGSAFYLCAAELLVYCIVFFCIEFFYLHKDFLWAIKSVFASIIVRIFYLQFLVQFISCFVVLRFTKNKILIFLAMLFSFLGYPFLMRGELPSLNFLFGFGIFGNSTPSLLVYFVSAIASSMFFSGYVLGRSRQ